MTQHNHIFQGLKPQGECHACDQVHYAELKSQLEELKDMIIFTVDELRPRHVDSYAMEHLADYRKWSMK